jgi:Ser/Thr protein kinase RdoA (MazF antagonist)
MTFSGTWKASTFPPRAPGEIICHGDYGPWNGVWRGGDVAGLIDWDHARPAAPIFDVAYALEYAAAAFRSPAGQPSAALASTVPPERQ